MQSVPRSQVGHLNVELLLKNKHTFMEPYRTIDWKKYVIVLLITGALFSSAFFLSNYFSEKKLSQVKTIQDKIAIDILSSETQFALLEDQSCKDVNNSILSQELNSLAEKIDYTEKNIGDTEQIIALKKYYSLLQIKDYLLMQKVSERCGFKSEFILYFYATENECTDCVKQSYVLTDVREKYPQLRVYSFDYNLDLSAIKALISIYKIDKNLPVLVINKSVYNGLQSVEEIEKAIPSLKDTLKKEQVKKSVIKTN